jgi:hypothetical protein
MKASPKKSSWDNLNGGTRLGIYLLLALPTGLFGIVVGYIIYLEATNSTVPVLSDFPPFIASVLIIGVSSIVVSIYMSTKKDSSHSDILGSLWILALLPMSISLFNDYTSVDLLPMVLIVVSAMLLWKGNRNMKWFLPTGIIIAAWFLFDPINHTVDFILLSTGMSGLGIVREGAQLALQRAFYDWSRLAFFLAV